MPQSSLPVVVITPAACRAQRSSLSPGRYALLLVCVAITALAVSGAITAGAVLWLQRPPALPDDDLAAIETQRLLDDLAPAIWEYYYRTSELPPDDGGVSWSTAALLEALAGADLYYAGEEQIVEGELVDGWGNPLRYRTGLGKTPEQCEEQGVVNAEGFDLWSAGADGFDGSDDDVVNWFSLYARRPDLQPYREPLHERAKSLLHGQDGRIPPAR